VAHLYGEPDAIMRAALHVATASRAIRVIDAVIGAASSNAAEVQP
jgi:hypothetical protein